MQLFLLATFTVILPNNSLALIDLPPPMVAAIDFTSYDLWTNAAITLTICLLSIIFIFLLYLLKHIFTLLCWRKSTVKKDGYEEI